jgi:hypothetical protein
MYGMQCVDPDPKSDPERKEERGKKMRKWEVKGQKNAKWGRM